MNLISMNPSQLHRTRGRRDNMTDKPAPAWIDIKQVRELLILLRRSPHTLDETADHLGLHRNTVRRLFSVLRDSCGILIEPEEFREGNSGPAADHARYLLLDPGIFDLDALIRRKAVADLSGDSARIKIKQAARVLLELMDRPMTLDELAEKIGLSRNRGRLFFKLMTANCGVSFGQDDKVDYGYHISDFGIFDKKALRSRRVLFQ